MGRRRKEARADGERRAGRLSRPERLEPRELLAADVVMFNDHLIGSATHPNVTGYATFTDSGGLLVDSQTGAPTSITLETSQLGVSFENATGTPASGTDAADIFDGWVDFSSQFGASIALTGGDRYTHSFSGLDPSAAYEFTGTAVRGNTGYTNRWTLVTLVGADSFTASHSAGVGTVTTGLPANQVALWTGENHRIGQGFVAQWSEIDPGADGEFEVVSQQYLGPTPGVGSGNASTGSKGYALAGVRLVEQDPSFVVVSSDPANGAALTSPPTTYTVNFSEPFVPGTVDAGDLIVDGAPATSATIVDADSIAFTLPPVTGEGAHTVTIAEGALIGAESGLPISAYDGTFAILSGSGIVINEIGYDVGEDNQPWEFVELLNVGDAPVDISGWRLDDAVRFTFPAGTVLGSGEHLVIAENPSELFAGLGISAIGPFDGKLNNQGEVLKLRDADDDLQDEVDYQLGYPWPIVGELPGHSIQLINPGLENDIGGAWRSAPHTAGESNSVFAINAPPLTRKVDHFPISPRSGEDVTITVKATDADGVASVALEYQLVEPGDYIAIDDPRYATSWTTVPMNDDGANGDGAADDDVYTAVLPGDLQDHRRLIRYRVTAVDTLGESITVPYADDTQPNFAYFVYDDTPDWSGAARPGVTQEVTYSGELLDSVATYHLITTRQDHVDSQFIPGSNRGSGYRGSEYLWDGALVYDGVVYDHIRYRARGGVWRYAMGKNMWKFDFNRGHDFHARDDYGEAYDVPWDRLNLSAIIQQGDFWHRGEQGLFESVGFKLFNMAGVEASNTNYVGFRIIADADENGADQYSGDFQGLYLAIEQLDDEFLEQHDLPDGNLYKMENGTGVGGIGGELNNLGDYPEPSDSSDLIEFKTTYESGPQTAEWWKENFNLDSYYSYRSIVEGIHHYDIGFGKNYFYYHNPETGKWQTVPWDLDLTWANNMFGNGAEPFRDRVLPIGEFGTEYRNRMREIRDLLYNTEQVGLIVDEQSSFVYTAGEPSLVDADRAMWDYNPILRSGYVNQNKAGHGRFYAGGGGIPAAGSFEGMKQVLVDYATTRGAWIDSNVLTDSNIVPETPTITYSGEAGFPIGGIEFTTSSFSGPPTAFGAMEWRIAEISNPDTPGFDPTRPWLYEIDSIWESGELETFEASTTVADAPLEPGRTYRARVRMQDTRNRWSHWSDPIEFVAAEPVDVPTLALTELHYHPNNGALADESDQEFFEILNTGAEPVDLSGVQVTDFAGDPYVFADGITLEPGEYLVVARDPVVFQSIYGTDVAIAPDGYGDAKLSNGGETIGLRAASGAQILSFAYDDSTPWPEASDGDGPSLEIIDPLGDPSDPANWRASLFDGGSPGTDGLTAPRLAGDYDGNGVVDQLDHQVWIDQFGQTPAVAGDGADGNADGVVDAGDYTVWRDNLGASQPAVVSLSLATLAFEEEEADDFAPATSEPTQLTPLMRDAALAADLSLTATVEPPLRPAVEGGLTASLADNALLLLADSDQATDDSSDSERDAALEDDAAFSEGDDAEGEHLLAADETLRAL